MGLLLMLQGRTKIFAIGHISIPILLLQYYLWQSPQPELLILGFISLAWTLYLTWFSIFKNNLVGIFRMKSWLWFLIIDSVLICVIYTLPDWSGVANPIWFLLFLSPLYAAEAGTKPTLYLSLIGLVNIILFNIVQGGSFLSTNTFIVVMGMLVYIFVGRVSDNLYHMAYYDTLTNLPNRTLFKNYVIYSIAEAQRNRRRIAVIFLDLDQFKYVNDTMGHAIGDLLLKAVAKTIKQAAPYNAVFARLGGDEFTLLLPNIVNAEEASTVADRIINTLKESFSIENQEIYISSSIGIALFPDDGNEVQTLMKNADSAMYKAKEQGRNNYQFYTVSKAHSMPYDRITMETMLRQALDRNLLTVHYQPRMELKTGKIISLEALVRWPDPEIGFIRPKDFIPLAEETGLIVQLGEQVLRTACLQIKNWQNAGYPALGVSVNLSTRQFNQQNLPDAIRSILLETKLQPKFLELEITESSAMRNVNFTVNMLKELKEIGISISIDDFGTGYSSLSYLKRLPIDVLKIDRSFTNSLYTDPADSAIVTAIIVLAQTLNLRVVAEGVETEEQLTFLEQQRCNEVQGYLLGKPMPVKEMEEWLLQEKMMSS